MIRGLDIFKKSFSPFPDCFVIIGGTACDLLYGEAGLTFRATKDIDMVLCLDTPRPDFGRTFWDFITKGQYNHCETTTAYTQYYRFTHPFSSEYPHMIELFSRIPSGLSLPSHAKITPIPMSEDISSLSAIVLDKDYYTFLNAGKTIVEELPVANVAHLIPLKAKAWIDLTQRKADGAHIDSTDIKKHRNDIVRLLQLLPNTFIIDLPASINEDMITCRTMLTKWTDFNGKLVGNTALTLGMLIDQLTRIYRLH